MIKLSLCSLARELLEVLREAFTCRDYDARLDETSSPSAYECNRKVTGPYDGEGV
jgi:hypothetical protein